MSDPIERLQILPTTTVEQIAEMCRAFSDDAAEVICRVESVNGKPVAFLVRESRSEQIIPTFLRRQAS